jgi:subtilisin family serine protease
MKETLSLLLCLSLLTFTAQPARGQGSSRAHAALLRHEQAISNSYIVVFKDEVAAAQVDAAAARLTHFHGGQVVSAYRYALRGFSAQMSPQVAEAMSRHPLVEYVEEDVVVELAATQQSAPWGLDRIDQRDLSLNSTYSYAHDGAGVHAYVIDSGIRTSHQEFGGRASVAFDNVGDGQNGEDCFGHGTHVASVVGGQTFGVAKAAQLHSVRVFNCANGGSSVTKLIEAIDWVTANHQNPSVTVLSVSTVGSTSLDTAVRNSIAAGITYVVAAGNGPLDASNRSPARVTEAITVGATDMNDTRASFSNFGAVLDLFAPGVNIPGANWDSDASTTTRDGTSMAAAHVAGMAARLLGENPGESPERIGERIAGAATPGKVINPGTNSTNRLLFADNAFRDDFNDNSVNTVKWGVSAAAGGTLVEQNKRLEITPPASTTGYGSLYADSLWDMTDGRATVELVQTTQFIYGIETYFSLADNATGNYLLFATGGAGLVLQERTNGAVTRTIITYDPTQHRFWRLRHDKDADTVNWETSPDGVNWTTRRTAARTFSVTGLQVQLIAGKYTATTPTSTAIFDNVRLAPNPSPPVLFYDNFNDNSTDTAKWSVAAATGVTVVEQNKRLEITPSPSTTGYGLYRSVSTLDMTDAAFAAEVVQTSAGSSNTGLRIGPDDTSYIQIVTEAGGLYFQYWIGSSRSQTSTTYNAAQHRYWRIRHDAATDTINWETSADAVTWATQRTAARPFAIDAAYLTLLAGKWTNTNSTAPGTAIFDTAKVTRRYPPLEPSDDFNDNSLDAARWQVLNSSSVTVAEQNQRLEMALQPNTAAYNGVISVRGYDFKDRTLSVEIPQATSQGGWAETYFQLKLDDGNLFHMSVGAGSLVCDAWAGGVRDRTALSYNPTNHRFWRFRHNGVAHTVSFETSPNGTTWTTLKTVAAGFSFDSLRVLMLAGAWGTGNGSPGTAVYDNLKLERNE